MRIDEAIEELGGLVAAAGGHGDDALEAVKDTLAGLPAVDGEWLTPMLPALVNQVEACELLGVTKATMIRWRKPGSGEHGPDRTYMIPARMAGSAPVWVLADVERFRDEIGRQRAPVAAAS